MPARSDELPYESTFAPVVDRVGQPVGPPQNGIDGLTLPWSAGSSRTSAKSL